MKRLLFLGCSLLMLSMLIVPSRVSAEYYWPNDFGACASNFFDNAWGTWDTYDTDMANCENNYYNCISLSLPNCAAEYNQCVANAEGTRNSGLDNTQSTFNSCLNNIDTRPLDYDHCANAGAAAQLCNQQFVNEFDAWVACRAASGVDQCQ